LEKDDGLRLSKARFLEMSFYLNDGHVGEPEHKPINRHPQRA
jgi:hypothetical protein